MSYFAVVLTRTEQEWDANEADLDAIEDLADLADAMRAASPTAEPDSTFLLFLEQEDAWFAVVRVDGEDDPRVFVSDDGAIGASAYAEMLLAATGADGETADLLDGFDEFNEDGSGDTDDDADPPAELHSGPVGDPDLLADLGSPADTLLALCAKEGMLPSEVLTVLAEAAGAAEPLESAR